MKKVQVSNLTKDLFVIFLLQPGERRSDRYSTKNDTSFSFPKTTAITGMTNVAYSNRCDSQNAISVRERFVVNGMFDMCPLQATSHVVPESHDKEWQSPVHLD